MLKMSLSRNKSGKVYPIFLAFLAGALVPFSLSPFDIWPLSLVSIFLLLCVLRDIAPARAALLGWCYGLGYFGLGASWVYVSISVYGNTSVLFAAFLTGLFVGGLALLFALQAYLYQAYFRTLRIALSFASLWVLFEWMRSWLFTGFPWLYLGYAHTTSWLHPLAPVLGVLGISFAVVFYAGLLYEMFELWHHQKFDSPLRYGVYAGILCLLGLMLWLLDSFNWVQVSPDKSAEVALVQANIDQNLKFDPAYINQGISLYEELSAQLWGNDIIIWPETAIPILYQRAGSVLGYFDQQARASNSTLVSGILYREENGDTYNSITALGNGSGVYHKQKLVPFGEYVPLSALMKSVLQLFALPMSSLTAGPADQSLLRANDFTLASYICYEVVYPDFVRQQAYQADFLVTISNDTWFGASIGPLQHLQMAAMRALENGRYMVRATSNGLTAFINEQGQVLAKAPQFEVATLSSRVPAISGRTPFSYWGSWPVVLLSMLVLVLMVRSRKNHL
jgi:apolipoprotein N-acyltransferase